MLAPRALFKGEMTALGEPPLFCEQTLDSRERVMLCPQCGASAAPLHIQLSLAVRSARRSALVSQCSNGAWGGVPVWATAEPERAEVCGGGCDEAWCSARCRHLHHTAHQLTCPRNAPDAHPISELHLMGRKVSETLLLAAKAICVRIAAALSRDAEGLHAAAEVEVARLLEACAGPGVSGTEELQATAENDAAALSRGAQGLPAAAGVQVERLLTACAGPGDPTPQLPTCSLSPQAQTADILIDGLAVPPVEESWVEGWIAGPGGRTPQLPACSLSPETQTASILRDDPSVPAAEESWAEAWCLFHAALTDRLPPSALAPLSPLLDQRIYFKVVSSLERLLLPLEIDSPIVERCAELAATSDPGAEPAFAPLLQAARAMLSGGRQPVSGRRGHAKDGKAGGAKKRPAGAARTGAPGLAISGLAGEGAQSLSAAASCGSCCDAPSASGWEDDAEADSEEQVDAILLAEAIAAASGEERGSVFGVSEVGSGSDLGALEAGGTPGLGAFDAIGGLDSGVPEAAEGPDSRLGALHEAGQRSQNGVGSDLGAYYEAADGPGALHEDGQASQTGASSTALQAERHAAPSHGYAAHSTAHRIATMRRAGLLHQRAASLFAPARGQFVFLPAAGAPQHSCLPVAQFEPAPIPTLQESIFAGMEDSRKLAVRGGGNSSVPAPLTVSHCASASGSSAAIPPVTEGTFTSIRASPPPAPISNNSNTARDNSHTPQNNSQAAQNNSQAAQNNWNRAPNNSHRRGWTVGVVALRDLKAGDPLTVAWVHAAAPLAERCRQLRARFGANFVCGCVKCAFEEAGGVNGTEGEDDGCEAGCERAAERIGTLPTAQAGRGAVSFIEGSETGCGGAAAVARQGTAASVGTSTAWPPPHSSAPLNPPSPPWPWLDLAIAAVQDSRFSDAAVLAQRQLRASKGANGEASHLLGAAHLAMGDIVAAREAWRAGAAADPVHAGLAATWSKCQKYTLADDTEGGAGGGAEAQITLADDTGGEGDNCRKHAMTNGLGVGSEARAAGGGVESPSAPANDTGGGPEAQHEPTSPDGRDPRCNAAELWLHQPALPGAQADDTGGGFKAQFEPAVPAGAHPQVDAGLWLHQPALPAGEVLYFHNGARVVCSMGLLLSPAECDACVALAEGRASSLGGWTTSRHYAVPTTDLPVHDSDALLGWFTNAFRTRIAPWLAQHMHTPITALAVHDAFVIKYSAAAQRLLPLHIDESTLSFTLPLNRQSEYDGGGTYFGPLGRSVRPPMGALVAFHGGRVLHGGEPVVRGTRYVLAAFLYVRRDPTRGGGADAAAPPVTEARGTKRVRADAGGGRGTAGREAAACRRRAAFGADSEGVSFSFGFGGGDVGGGTGDGGNGR